MHVEYFFTWRQCLLYARVPAFAFTYRAGYNKDKEVFASPSCHDFMRRYCVNSIQTSAAFCGEKRRYMVQRLLFPIHRIKY